MATLLQQWARRYLQIVQRKYAPLHNARIHEYFSRGARRFGISGFVEVLPLLLLLSVFLFFAGLVVFAFQGNRIVAYFTVGIVGFCALSYIVLTLMPLIFHDCPYQTPLTSVLWFSAQMISHSFLSVLYHGAKLFPKRRGTVSGRILKSFRHRQKFMFKSLSENIISKLESSTEYISIDTSKKMLARTLARTLHWLNEDHELEQFVAGIPGLYESEAFATRDNTDVQHTIRPVLAALPGPTNFHVPLSWSIIGLAQRAIMSDTSKFIQQRRTRTCLKALYHIPGAIRDVIASYAAGRQYCVELLPLLNSPESLEIIGDLWDSPVEDAALSVRCVAAVVAAFMINPPHHVLENFLTPNVPFIGDDYIGQQFLARKLLVGGDAPEYQPNSDATRLQNIEIFLADIRDTLLHMNTPLWTSENADVIHSERRGLFEARHSDGYRAGRIMLDQHGDRESPAFVPAAQQDLITLTLEILLEDCVVHAAPSQRNGFLPTCLDLVRGNLSQAWGQQQAENTLEMIEQALRPVLRRLEQTEEIHSHNGMSLSQGPVSV
jgi:hypothetical protein